MKRILVVDDNHDTADTLAMLLQASGHDARTAADGPQALAQLKYYKPDMVVLDIGLPGMDGYTIARQMRAQPDLESTTLVALTGYDREEDRRKSLEAGFNHYLVKPVELKDLVALLHGT
jgi:CheY-like chemotaxis protein